MQFGRVAKALIFLDTTTQWVPRSSRCLRRAGTTEAGSYSSAPLRILEQFLQDAAGRITSYQYDVLNRRSTRTLPLDQLEVYTYDPVGNLASKTDFNGLKTVYAYDKLNRLLSKTPDPSLNETKVSFTYTSTGQRATMTDSSGTTNYVRGFAEEKGPMFLAQPTTIAFCSPLPGKEVRPETCRRFRDSKFSPGVEVIVNTP